MTSFSDDLALTIEILESLTSHKFDYSDEAVWFPNDAAGYTHNNHPIRSMFGLPTDWTIYYKVDREDVIPHEICHVIDGISTHYQHSLKKDFKPIVDDYQTLWSLKWILVTLKQKKVENSLGLITQRKPKYSLDC